MFANAASLKIIGGTFMFTNHQARLSSPQNLKRLKGEENIVCSETHKVPLHLLVDAVSPTALHNSGAIYDHPTCHPGTRIALMDDLMNWSMRKDSEGNNSSIKWLYGRAGVGKSTIARTLAERFSSGPLLASFFFSRTDPTRNNARSFVATLAYQIYLHVPLLQKCCILSAIQESPHFLTQSISSQFETLVSNPLRDLFRSGYFQDFNSRRLIIIDGLDECADLETQLEVLRTVSRVVSAKVPFLFLLSSGPALHIHAALNSSPAPPAQISLDHADASDTDIRIFIHHRFRSCRETHPFRHYLPPDWPSKKDIARLITISSGQFIYAATAMKFIDSPRHMPAARLSSILELHVSESQAPSAQLDPQPNPQLDALYVHVLQSADNTADLLRILALLDYSKNSLPISLVDAILQISFENADRVLLGMASLVSISHGDKYPYLSLKHASLAEFLRDHSRPQRYGLRLTDSSEIIRACTRFLKRSKLNSASLAVLKKLIDGPAGEIVVNAGDLDDGLEPLHAAQAATFCLRYLCDRKHLALSRSDTCPLSPSDTCRRRPHILNFTVHQQTLRKGVRHAEKAIRPSPSLARHIPPEDSVVTKPGALTSWDCHLLTYRTALAYLIKLLRLAEVSPELHARCQLQIFSPTSMEFPVQSWKARRAMAAYVQRCALPSKNELI